MLRNVKTSLLPLVSIVTGVGLLAAGCTDNPPTDENTNPAGCVADDTTFAIDHSDLLTVDGAPPRANEKLEYRGALAAQESYTLKVAQCGVNLHVTFAADGTGLDTSDLYVVEATRDGKGIKGTLELPLADEAGTLLAVSFHATAMR